MLDEVLDTLESLGRAARSAGHTVLDIVERATAPLMVRLIILSLAGGVATGLTLHLMGW